VDLLQQMVQDQEGSLQNHSYQLENGSKGANFSSFIYYLFLANIRFSEEALKVLKRENFSTAFFAQSEPIWIYDVGTSKKIEFFYQLTPDFDGFWFFAAY
jgi:hypothetical protein